MAIELWEYILILVSAEIVLVLVVLLSVWQYCRVTHNKRKGKESKNRVAVGTQLEEDDILDDLFKTKMAGELETGLPPVSSEQDFGPIRPKMKIFTPEQEEEIGFDMGNPPPYASKESSFIYDSEQESSTDPAPKENHPRYIAVSDINDNEDSLVIHKPQMRPGTPTPTLDEENNGDTEVNFRMDTDKKTGRLRFEALWLMKPQKKKTEQGTIQSLQEV